MAKATEKKAAIPKAATVKKSSVKKVPSTPGSDIEKACVAAMTKLKALDIEPQLQADIEWCLGSYSHDKNPIGLYEMGERALEVFKSQLEKKRKGVTAKMVADLEKAVKAG